MFIKSKQDDLRLSKKKACNCPNSKVGFVAIDVLSHLRNCPIRKKLLSQKYTIDTSVYSKLTDGYRLGVAA